MGWASSRNQTDVKLLPVWMRWRAGLLTLPRSRPTIRVGTWNDPSHYVRGTTMPTKVASATSRPKVKLTKLFIDNKWMDPVDGGEFET